MHSRRKLANVGLSSLAYSEHTAEAEVLRAATRLGFQIRFQFGG